MQTCSNSVSSNNCCQCCCPRKKKRKEVCGCPPPGTQFCPGPTNGGDYCVRPDHPNKKKSHAEASGDYGQPPPPPPGDEKEWDLQYCKWWGWNWVRRRQEQQMGGSPTNAPEGGYCIPVQCYCKHHKKKGCACRSFCKKLFKGKKKNKCPMYYCGHPSCCPPPRQDQGQEPNHMECQYYTQQNNLNNIQPQQQNTNLKCQCGPPKNKEETASSFGAPSIQDDMERVSVKLHEKNKQTRRYVCYPAGSDRSEKEICPCPKRSNESRHSNHSHRHDHDHKDSRESLKRDSRHSRDTRRRESKEMEPIHEKSEPLDTHSHHNLSQHSDKNVHSYMLHDISHMYNPYFNLYNSDKKFSKFGQPYTKFSWMDNLEKSFNKNYNDEFRSPLTGKTYSLNLTKVNTEFTTTRLPDFLNPGNLTFTVSGSAKTPTNNLYEALLSSILSPNLEIIESPRESPKENFRVLEDVKSNLNRVDNLMQKLLDDNSSLSTKNYSNISLKPCKRCLSEESIIIEPKKPKYNENCDIEDTFHNYFHYFNDNHSCKNTNSIITSNSSSSSVSTARYNLNRSKKYDCIHTINSATTELLNSNQETAKSDVTSKSSNTLIQKRSFIPVRKN